MRPWKPRRRSKLRRRKTGSSSGFDKLSLKDLRCSRLRCLLLTGMPSEDFARTLTGLAKPDAAVDAGNHRWVPRGMSEPDETKLVETDVFVMSAELEVFTSWWLKVRRNANVPNWDAVSTCTIEGRRGLILVEAKAHDEELFVNSKTEPRTENDWTMHQRISAAIQQANDGLNRVIPGWRLSRDTHYQLCNRFAWVAIVLDYLGFLNATEMIGRGSPSTRAKDWDDRVRNQAGGIVPDQAWGKRLDVDCTPLWPLIRSLGLGFDPYWLEGRT